MVWIDQEVIKGGRADGTSMIQFRWFVGFPDLPNPLGVVNGVGNLDDFGKNVQGRRLGASGSEID